MMLFELIYFHLLCWAFISIQCGSIQCGNLCISGLGKSFEMFACFLLSIPSSYSFYNVYYATVTLLGVVCFLHYFVFYSTSEYLLDLIFYFSSKIFIFLYYAVSGKILWETWICIQFWKENLTHKVKGWKENSQKVSKLSFLVLKKKGSRS